jgi:DNA processing protein
MRVGRGSIVGTRKATAYGRRIARAWTRELVDHGWVITSGLAYGIDAVAYQAALEAGGCTVAVMGSGLDRIYPGDHRALARSITAQGGILTELPFGTKPDAVNFPRRNRIVSGLSSGTLVVEAYESGGALITARMAAEQNREVFAVPGAIDQPAGLGCNRLIQRAQARLVLSVAGILAELPGIGGDPGQSALVPAEPPLLNGIERRLYEALGADPRHIDRICTVAGTDVSSALVYLLSLEVKGLVVQMAGKHFYRLD